MPLAFALVDEETTLSLCSLHCHFSRAILKGIIAAMRGMLQKYPSFGVHRFCLEHIKANLLSNHRKKGLRNACQMLGTELDETKYNNAWRRLNQLYPEAAGYLREIGGEMWTLFEDGGNRWGLSTTNLSESYNNVLKGARHLPIRAMVESTLEKCAYIFRRDRPIINTCNTPLRCPMSHPPTDRVAERHDVD